MTRLGPQWPTIAQFSGGICGIGGGVVIKPLLDATGIMSVSTVSFLSGLTVLAMALISVYKNRKTKELDAKRSIPLGVAAGAIGGFVSAKLHRKLSAGTTDKLFSGLLVVIFLIGCYNAIKWM